MNKQTVPKERVRLGKETVKDRETVTGQVRKEEVEVDDQTASHRKRPQHPLILRHGAVTAHDPRLGERGGLTAARRGRQQSLPIPG